MKNILLIGAGGFIGKNIVEQLSADGYNLFLLTRKNYVKPNLNNVKFISGSLHDLEVIKKSILKDKIDCVIHLASNLIPSSTDQDFKEEYSNVILPTFDLIDFLAEKGLAFVYFSSGGTVYDATNSDITENHKLDPRNYYGYSKFLIESQIRLFHKMKNLSYIIIRPSNAYGRYQRIDKEQGFIAVALNKVFNNQPIRIFGDGLIIRDYLDVSDLSIAFSKVLKSGAFNLTLNFGSGVGTSLLEIVEIIKKHSERNLTLEFSNSRPVDNPRIVLNIDSLKSIVEFNPINLELGIYNYIRSLRRDE